MLLLHSLSSLIVIYLYCRNVVIPTDQSAIATRQSIDTG